MKFSTTLKTGIAATMLAASAATIATTAMAKTPEQESNKTEFVSNTNSTTRSREAIGAGLALALLTGAAIDHNKRRKNSLKEASDKLQTDKTNLEKQKNEIDEKVSKLTKERDLALRRLGVSGAVLSDKYIPDLLNITSILMMNVLKLFKT